MKEIGKIKNVKSFYINALTLKNGEQVTKFYNLPLIVSNYTPPENCPDYIKGETLSLWFKMGDSRYIKIEEQLKKEIREIGIWLIKDEIRQLRDFLNSINLDEVN